MRSPRQPALGWLAVLIAFNTVSAGGLLGDIARHVSVGPNLVTDNFLAGWHLVLYGGVAGVAATLGLYALRHGPGAPWRDLRLTVVGMGVLTGGGLIDSAWHELFGIEASFQALVSPPHLVIFAGLVALMASPINLLATAPQRRLGWGESVVVATSLISLIVVITLFTGYLTPLVGGSDFSAGSYTEALVGANTHDYEVSRSLASALWFGVITSVIVAVISRRFRPRPGTWLLTFGLVGLTPPIVSGSDALPLLGALFAFGVATELATRAGPPKPLGAGLAVAGMWASLFGILAIQGGLEWDQDLWFGVVLTGFGAGAAIGILFEWVEGGRAVRG